MKEDKLVGKNAKKLRMKKEEILCQTSEHKGNSKLANLSVTTFSSRNI